MGTAADIDRLIEEGLNRYGAGDLDGALHVWEQALAIDPENAQANSYVDYVRLNYEVLQADSGLGVAADSSPFGIEDEPEYIIEITRGEISPGGDPAPLYMDPSDEGWFIEEEQTQELLSRTRSGKLAGPTGASLVPGRAPSADLPPRTVEIEADEPPLPDPPAPPAPSEAQSPPPVVARTGSAGEITFDSATREYGSDERAGHPATTSDFGEEVSSFRAESTPLGFAQVDTEIRKRDLGFVQPTHGPAPLEVRLRTPSAPPPQTMTAAPTGNGDLELAGAGRGEDGLARTARGLTPVTRTPASTGPPVPRSSTEDDLIASLPSPRRVTPLRGSQPPPDLARIPTREMPDEKRPPAVSDRAETTRGGPDAPAVSTSESDLLTLDAGLDGLDGPEGRAGLAGLGDESATSAAAANDDRLDPAGTPFDHDDDEDEIALGTRATRDLESSALGDFAVSAPTRDLGLRPSDAPRRPASVYPEDDVPTRQNDARQIREEHSTQRLKPVHQAAAAREVERDGTRHDLVLPFDPIDARTAQILDEIEPPEGAPPDESKEDRTRRRITTLIGRATQWSAALELDKSVAAVDLALSEDPNSALAQKLIHRNRDAIMNIFQNFLGDLDRQPQLARPLHELASAPISPRAAFLLSRIDGTLTVDEILDVSGMPRLEAYRHLCQLFLRGILR